MLESYPSFFWVFGAFVQPTRCLRAGIPKDVQMEFVARALVGCDMFLREKSLRDALPTSTKKVEIFRAMVLEWTQVLAGTAPLKPGHQISSLGKMVDTLTITLQNELDEIQMYTVTPKGNLSTKALAKDASAGYPASVLDLLDDFIKGEIKHAGKCLAFDLPTACGFHILRAVEILAKAYVHAATGTLPPIKNRNWGEYIFQLKNAGAHQDTLDVLTVLKTKRNPLMHPQDSINTDEAISILCMAQSSIETIAVDIMKRNLELTFKKSLEALPTL